MAHLDNEILAYKRKETTDVGGYDNIEAVRSHLAAMGNVVSVSNVNAPHGTVYKRGHGLSIFGSTGWRQRFVILMGDTLYCYKDLDTFMTRGKYQKEPYFLDGYQVTAVALTTASELTLSKPGGKSLTLRVPAAKTSAWVSALQGAIATANMSRSFKRMTEMRLCAGRPIAEETRVALQGAVDAYLTSGKRRYTKSPVDLMDAEELPTGNDNLWLHFVDRNIVADGGASWRKLAMQLGAMPGLPLALQRIISQRVRQSEALFDALTSAILTDSSFLSALMDCTPAAVWAAAMYLGQAVEASLTRQSPEGIRQQCLQVLDAFAGANGGNILFRAGIVSAFTHQCFWDLATTVQRADATQMLARALCDDLGDRHVRTAATATTAASTSLCISESDGVAMFELLLKLLCLAQAELKAMSPFPVFVAIIPVVAWACLTHLGDMAGPYILKAGIPDDVLGLHTSLYAEAVRGVELAVQVAPLALTPALKFAFQGVDDHTIAMFKSQYYWLQESQEVEVVASGTFTEYSAGMGTVWTSNKVKVHDIAEKRTVTTRLYV